MGSRAPQDGGRGSGGDRVRAVREVGGGPCGGSSRESRRAFQKEGQSAVSGGCERSNKLEIRKRPLHLAAGKLMATRVLAWLLLGTDTRAGRTEKRSIEKPGRETRSRKAGNVATGWGLCLPRKLLRTSWEEKVQSPVCTILPFLNHVFVLPSWNSDLSEGPGAP